MCYLIEGPPNFNFSGRPFVALMAFERRGTARDSACADKNGAWEGAGQPAEQCGTAFVSIIMGRGEARDSAGQRGTARGTARDSVCVDNNGPREPHPVWGFKNIKGRGVGVGALMGEVWLSLVSQTLPQTGLGRNCASFLRCCWTHDATWQATTGFLANVASKTSEFINGM